MFMSSAFAQTAAGGADFSSMLNGFGLPLILMLGVFYFMVFRPQQQRMKELKQSQSSLRRGDKIVTAGGVIGQVTRAISDEEVEVQVAEGVKVRVLRNTISTVLSKSEPAARDGKPAEAEPAESEETPAAKKRRSTTSAK